MTYPDQPPASQPPGWYPDPSGQPVMRWWDGYSWAPTGAGAPPVVAAPVVKTSGKAITALVCGILGGFAAGIGAITAVIFGLIALGEIKRSNGWLRGKGLATAGVVLGSFWIVGLATIVVLGISGAFEKTNAEKFTDDPDKHDIAVLVDRVEKAFDDDDATLICAELITPDLAETLARSSSGCEAAVKSAAKGVGQVDIVIQSITFSGGAEYATAQIDEGGTAEVWSFEKRGGTWLVDQIQ